MSDSYGPFGCVVTAPNNSRSHRPDAAGDRGFHARLTSFLLFMVPMFIAELRDASEEQIDRAREDALEQIASHGDDLQFGGTHQRSSRTALAKGFAVLARAEGGVTALGVHACLHPHEGCPGLQPHGDTTATTLDDSQEQT